MNVTEKARLTVRVGTRESKLAMLQTDVVAKALTDRAPELKLEIVPITTHGDKALDKPLSQIGRRGVFVKELEEALLARRIDLVVHSLKDLPTTLPEGLALAAVLDRLDARDVLVSRDRRSFAQLPPGSRVATSSRRRTAQMASLRSDLEFVDVRGNIPTRLNKHEQGECEALILAAAGLLRLGLTDRIAEYLDPEVSTPAVGQGALAVECRQDDEAMLALLRQLDDPVVRAEVTAERAFLHELGGGCSVPIGALCVTLPGGKLRLVACVAALDGSRVVRRRLEGPPERAHQLGVELAGILLAEGAGDLLAAIKQSAPAVVSPP